jgi:transposase
MKHYAGLDVSLEETSVCVIDEEGEIVAERKVASEPEAIARALSRWQATLCRVGLEAGGLTPWLYPELWAQGVPAICIETRRMKAFAKASPVKTDRRDARLIAQAIRAGLYQAVHVKSQASHKLRLALTNRQKLLRQARELEGKIRGDLKVFGIKLGKVGSGGFAKRVKEKLAEHQDLLVLAQPLLEIRARQLAEVRAYDRLLRRLCKADPACRLFVTAPGIGVQTALAYRATIECPQRFARSSQVPPVLGLTPRIDESGERSRHGAITKAGDGLLRSLLFEAANALLTRTSRWCALKRWGLEVAKRRGMNRARVAVARKLAIILHRMWCDGTEFRWGAEPAPAK